MAMSMAGSSGGGGRRRGRKSVMAEINVTPMVDVMLVLLIIFMVAAPLMTTSIDVSLPSATGGAPQSQDTQQLNMTVQRTGGTCNSQVAVYLNDAQLPAGEIADKVKAIGTMRSETQKVVNVLADKDACYSDVMKLLGALRDAGFKASAAVLPE